MKKVRVRYAPSPTGHLHIGGARTALFNYLFAKNKGGDFIVRIEDTDIKRNIENGEASQLENLEWLGILPDESPVHGGNYGPYRQTERIEIYNKYVKELLNKGVAYECYCSSEELETSREEQTAQGVASPRYNGRCRNLTAEDKEVLKKQGITPTIRVRVPEEVEFKWTDIVRGDVSILGKDIGDWVIVKSDGIPTYNFAVVIDDHTMEISHVFRGEEHTSNTPKQIHLYETFGWEIPAFGHMTLIVNEDRKKLSKRDESIMQFVSQYKEEGYLPEAMFNFFALLGWSPEGEEEIFSKDELIKMFDANRLSKSSSMFDRDKLKWINNKYIKNAPLIDVINLARPFLADAYDLSNKSDEWINKLVELYKNEMSYGKEIVGLSKMFFSDFELDEEAKEFMKQEGIDKTIEIFKSEVSSTEVLNVDSISSIMNNVKEKSGAKGKMLFMPLRIASTGQMHGPDLKLTIELIGKDELLKRL